METKKTCSKCHRLKSRDEFHRNASRKDGLQSRCKKCQIGEVMAYHKANPDKAYKHKKNWRLRHPEKRKAQTARYRKKHPKRALTRYGITVDQFNELVAKFAGKCHICKRRKATSVDHCHKTGVVRGVLCVQCNFALGHLSDDPGVTDSAAAYLRVTRTA